ncbi:MAG: extracellular solute-binding protein [Thermodesulfobacteria bacterium]|nr:extracellular solute-binding protein [Thermodesulfobacteriota bacterium]
MRRWLWLLCVLPFFLVTCGKEPPSSNEVVVYTSTDQVFSEPVLQEFERRTGIKVHMVFDTEETKSTGLMNRLLAEKDHPRCDVFWSNDPLRVEILKQKGVLAPYRSPQAAHIPDRFKDPEGYWTGFSGRIRVFVVNKDLLSPAEYPRGLRDMLAPRFKGAFALANPLFGTTSFHVAALFVAWGDEEARAFLEGLKKNGLKLASSNGEVARWVALGKVKFGLVDNDDAFSVMEEGAPVEMVIPDQNGEGTLFMPNAVALIKGAPHPEAAKKLIDFLLSPVAEEMLARATCRQIPLNPAVPPPPELPPLSKLRLLEVDYAKVAQKMEEILPYLRRWVAEK